MISYEEKPVYFGGVKLDVKIRNGTIFWEGPEGTPGYEPPNAWYGMSPYHMMVPPIKPRRMAMIGTFQNAVGRLIKQIHADWDGLSESFKPAEIEIDLVDTVPAMDGVIQSDGITFLRSKPERYYDFMVVDVYKLGTLDFPKEYFTEEFSQAAKASHTFCMNLVRARHQVDYWPRIDAFEKDWELQSYKVWRNHFVPFFKRRK